MCRTQNRYVRDGVEVSLSLQSLPVTWARLLHGECIAEWPNVKHALVQCRYSKSMSQRAASGLTCSRGHRQGPATLLQKRGVEHSCSSHKQKA